MIKRLAVSVATAGTLALVATPAYADCGKQVGCNEIGVQVTVADGDPSGLDADGDGVGCEAQVAPPVQQNPDLSIGEFPGQYLHCELAATGVGNWIDRHPIRAYGAAAGIVLLGGGIVVVARRRKG